MLQCREQEIKMMAKTQINWYQIYFDRWGFLRKKK